MKEGKKIGVSIGLFIATLLIGMYGEGGGVGIPAYGSGDSSSHVSIPVDTSGINISISQVYPWYTGIHSRTTEICAENAGCYGTACFTVL